MPVRSRIHSRRNLGFLVAKASQRWNEILHEKFREAGYPEVRPAYGSILIPLYEENGLQMGELARRSRLSKQTMTTLVRRLEDVELVERQRDPEDGRAYRIYLAPRGRRFEKVVVRVLEEMDEMVKATFSESDFAQLRDCLERLMNLTP